MTVRSAISRSVGLAAESTYGTFVAPTRHIPIIGESIEPDYSRIDNDDVIRAGRFTQHSDDQAPGRVIHQGAIQTLLYDRSVGIFLQHVLGSGSTSGAGPYTTPLVPGSSTGKSLSIQVGRPSTDGTVQPFSYTGVKTRMVKISGTKNEAVKFEADIIARAVTTATGLTAVSYAASAVPFRWSQFGTISLMGATNATVSEISITMTQELDEERLFLGSSVIGEPYQKGLTAIEISGVAEFESLTFHNNLVSGAVACYSIPCTTGSYSLTFAGTARMDAGHPTASGREIFKVPFTLKPMGTTDAAAFTATLVSPDTTP